MGDTISCTIPWVLSRIHQVMGDHAPKEGDIVLFPAAGICIKEMGKKMSVGRWAMEWHPDPYKS